MNMLATTATLTMSSLEMVEFINAERKGQAAAVGAQFPSTGYAKLEHSDFMKKVPQVLGGGAGNFSDTYVHPQNGQHYPCYRLPKREACLMAMSYSYELQAKVFDRMSALALSTTLMSSSEIANLTGKEHKNVLRDIRVQLLMVLCDKEVRSMHAMHGRTMALSAFVATNSVEMFKSLLVGDGSNLSHEQNQGFRVEVDDRKYIAAIHLNQTHTLTLMTGYDVVARAKVVTRWQELEAAATPPAPALPNFADQVAAARAWADAKEAEQKVVAALELAAPNVELVERYVQSQGAMAFRKVAKLQDCDVMALACTLSSVPRASLSSRQS